MLLFASSDSDPQEAALLMLGDKPVTCLCSCPSLLDPVLFKHRFGAGW